MPVTTAVPRAAALALLGLLAACGGDGARPVLDPINDDLPVSVGMLAGTVTRSGGAAASTLPITAQVHGVVVLSTTTDAGGAFTLRVTNLIAQAQASDTAVTVFVNGRTTVGAVADSLVLREPVLVRLSRTVQSPPVTVVQLSASY